MGHHLWEKVGYQHKISALSLWSAITHQTSKLSLCPIGACSPRRAERESATRSCLYLLRDDALAGLHEDLDPRIFDPAFWER